jgi:type IV pilus assembly protein PilM
MFEPSAAMPLPLVDVEETAGEWAAQQPLPEHGRNPYAASVEQSPYASPLVDAELSAGLHNAILDAPTSMGTLTEDASGHAVHRVERVPVEYPSAPNGTAAHADPLSDEIAQAVNVAAAYFEDTLASAPSQILSAGPLGADKLGRILAAKGISQTDGLRVRELVVPNDLLSEAVTAQVPRAWLSGVVGALRG